MAAKAAFSFRAEHIWLSRPINGGPREMSRGLGQIEQEILVYNSPKTNAATAPAKVWQQSN
jgi:hypothetical protein